jgi:hypothetical protein
MPTAIEPAHFPTIVHRILAPADVPRHSGYERHRDLVTGTAYGLESHRVVYRMDDTSQVSEIFKIGDRSDVYR